MSEHPGMEVLRSLADGTLTGQESDRLLSHLANCEPCFERFDPLLPPGLEAVGELDSTAEDRMQRRLLGRVRRATTLSDVLGFGSGFLRVVYILVQPLLGQLEGGETEKGRDQR